MSIRLALGQYWSTRSNRERAAILGAGVLALAAVYYAFFLEPGLGARRELAVLLPRLRARTEDLRREQTEILKLRKQLAAASRPVALKELLQSSAGRTSFSGAIERIEPLSHNRVLVAGAPLLFDDWLRWVDSLQREFAVRLDACKVEALDRPGMVRVEATFVSARQRALRSP
jgi:type II secretory pathway component PulM